MNTVAVTLTFLQSLPPPGVFQLESRPRPDEYFNPPREWHQTKYQRFIEVLRLQTMGIEHVES